MLIGPISARAGQPARLFTKTLLVALLYGQFSGAASLREIVGGSKSHATRLYHGGGKPVSRSTFADAKALGWRIVTRFRSNTPLEVTAALPVPESQDDILSDRIGLLTAHPLE